MIRTDSRTLLNLVALAALLLSGAYMGVSRDVPANAVRPAAALTAEQASAVAAALADLRDGTLRRLPRSSVRHRLEVEIDGLLALAASADPVELTAQAAAAASALDDLERAAGTSPADISSIRTLLAQIRNLAGRAAADTTNRMTPTPPQPERQP